jgi:hypothetical protein
LESTLQEKLNKKMTQEILRWALQLPFVHRTQHILLQKAVTGLDGIYLYVDQWSVHNFYKSKKVVPTLQGLRQKLASSIGFKGGLSKNSVGSGIQVEIERERGAHFNLKTRHQRETCIFPHRKLTT